MRRLIVLISCIMFTLQVFANEPIRIWEGTSVNAKNVTLTPYLPKSGESKASVIVCPGGSYFWLSREDEGSLVGEWLADNGIAAFVLEYRTGGVFDFLFGERLLSKKRIYPDMLLDVQNSIRIVRNSADEFGIDPDRLGVMGFSAGGHLSMLSAERSDLGELEKIIGSPLPSLKPSFVAPIYPVVTMSDSRYVHKRSRRGLLGEGRTHNKALRDSLSLEKNVPDDCCPVFLLNCIDDPTVDYHNSELLASALSAKKISHEYFQFREGGHGFGANKSKMTAETLLWQEEFLNWLNNSICNGK